MPKLKKSPPQQPDAPHRRPVEIERERLRRLIDQYRPPRRSDRRPSGSAVLIIPLQPAGGYFWENMSIGMSDESPVVGVPNTLKVVVRNCGALPALGTVAEFKAGKPWLGIGPDFLHPAGKSIPKLIEKGKQREIVSATPWIPKETESGHQCLMVTCWALNDSQNLQWWQPKVERRCAQRNVNVSALMLNTTMSLRIGLSNLLPMRGVHRVMASVEQVTAPRKLLEQIPRADLPARVLASTVATRTVRASIDARLPMASVASQRLPEDFTARPVGLAVRSRLSEGMGTIGATGAKEALANLLLASDRLTQATESSLASNLSVLHEVSLHPYELREISVELDAPQGTRRGDYLVYRLVQVAEGMLLGGYTAIVRVE